MGRNRPAAVMLAAMRQNARSMPVITTPSGKTAKRTTRFQVRPGSPDRPDRAVAFDHFVQERVPRRLQRFAYRLNPFRG